MFAPEQKPSTNTAHSAGSSPAPSMTEIRILYVDDSASLRLTISELLKYEGYNVTACADVKEAQASLESNTFSLAIVDGDLGDKRYDPDGLAGQLVMLLSNKGIRVIRLTADPESIPASVSGEGVYDKTSISSMVDWMGQNIAAKAQEG